VALLWGTVFVWEYATGRHSGRIYDFLCGWFFGGFLEVAVHERRRLTRPVNQLSA
jgi:hypothetical protein